MTVDCVLFDLYGTLVDIQVDEDSPRLWAGLAAAIGGEARRLDPAEVRHRYVSILREEAGYRQEGFILEPVFQRLLASFASSDSVGRIGRLFRELSVTVLGLRSYVAPLFDALREAGTKTGIVSNTEAVLTRFDLDRFPILGTLDTIVLSSEVGVRKPDPRIFHLALDRLHAAPAAAVHVGNDWDHDVLGARGAGLRAIHVDDRASATTVLGAGVVRAQPTIEGVATALDLSGWRGHQLS